VSITGGKYAAIILALEAEEIRLAGLRQTSKVREALGEVDRALVSVRSEHELWKRQPADRPWSWQPEAIEEQDRADIESVFGDIPLPTLDRYRRKTREMVRADWTAIENVAKWLLDSKARRMNAKEIERMINRPGPMWYSLAEWVTWQKDEQ
jgi:hypothetical protein